MVPPVEMGTMTKEEPGWRGATPLTLNGADGMSELRKRNTSNHSTEEEAMWALMVRASLFFQRLSTIEIDRFHSQPEPLTPTLDGPHTPNSPAQAPQSTTTISHTSTPSTIESSLLDFASPSTPLVALSPSQNVLPRTLSPDSVASQRDPLADSILSDIVHETLFSAHASPIQSPVRISPRGLQVNLTPMSDVDEGYTHPLSQGRDPSGTRSPRSPRSPLASTIYESFAGTQAVRSPSLPPSATLSPRVPPAQFVIHSPLSDSLSLVEHPTAPASTASWSDIGSAGAEGDRDELFFGSDAESWARAHNDRRT